MASAPLPDHYHALGVDKTADSAAIKSTYRKLVLKFHPDKVTDPAQKEAATDRFHQIQQAYETLVDPEKRGEYEAHRTLEALRQEKAARAPAARGEKKARFDGGAASYPPSPYATEQRKPSSRTAAYDDDGYFDERARTKHDAKYDTYDAYPKTGSTPRSARPDKASPRSARPAAHDRTRSDRDKTRAREARSDRQFNAVDSESSADEKARYEADYRRRSDEDAARKQAAESRRKAEDGRSYQDTRYAPSSARKLSVQEEEAIRYQHKSRGQVEADMTRPAYIRTSSRDAYGPEHRASRRPDPRPEAPRRSAARPKERTERTLSSSARGMPEIVDWSDDRTPPPVFKHTISSPANIDLPRSMPQRSFTVTETPREPRLSDKSPPATLLRSVTMPANHSAPRQKAPTAARPSGLRETMTSEHRSPEHDAFPSVPPPQPSSTSKKYYYTTSGGGGVTLRPEDIPGPASKSHTVLREPGRHHQRSPSPLSRPPIGPNRPSQTSTATYTTKPASALRPPPMDRTISSRNISPVRNSEDRGRSSRKLYGQVNSNSADPRRARQASYSPSEVQYAHKYGPEDVRWAPRGRENESDYPASKPALGRTPTFAY